MPDRCPVCGHRECAHLAAGRQIHLCPACSSPETVHAGTSWPEGYRRLWCLHCGAVRPVLARRAAA